MPLQEPRESCLHEQKIRSALDKLVETLSCVQTLRGGLRGVFAYLAS